MPEDALARELDCKVDWPVHTRRWLPDPTVRLFSELASDYHWASVALWHKQDELMRQHAAPKKMPALIARMEENVTTIERMRDVALRQAKNMRERLIQSGLLVPIVEESQGEPDA